MVFMDMRDIWEWDAADAWDAASPEEKQAVRARPHRAEGCSEPSDRLLVSNVEVSHVVSISAKKASKANLARWFSRVFKLFVSRLLG